jgi:hypothetical protein
VEGREWNLVATEIGIQGSVRPGTPGILTRHLASCVARPRELCGSFGGGLCVEQSRAESLTEIGPCCFPPGPSLPVSFFCLDRIET